MALLICGPVGTVGYLWEASGGQYMLGFPEVLRGACVGEVWPLTSGQDSRPIVVL